MKFVFCYTNTNIIVCITFAPTLNMDVNAYLLEAGIAAGDVSVNFIKIDLLLY